MTNNNIYFIANWKMYGNTSSINSINSVIKLSKKKKFKKATIVYCPPYTLLNQFVKKTKNSKIRVGAQNCHFSSNYGSFTGSINAKMIKNSGSKFVIIGHSENRINNGENNKIINQKIKSSLNENLNVIFCIGETISERKKKKTKQVLRKQILNGLIGIKKIEKILVSYEPVWSIGTGIIPDINDLKNQVKYIKKLLNFKYKRKTIKILYGGSVNSKNIISLNQIKDINGFLIGGASQKANNFIDIIKKSIN